ncbi:TPA: aldolase catalytic domain-containing protein [Campylobacter coli]|nr:aldolase catalytic domain-containing protein [Campylobacter coli]
MSIELLDCTIREAPIKELFFGEEFIQNFIYRLEKTNVDIIECGFLKDCSYVKGSTIFNKIEQITPYLKNKRKDLLYVALVDYGRYDLSQLSDCNENSIDGIRICFKKSEKDQVLRYAKEIQDKGYKVFIQHVDTLDYSDIEIIEFIQEVNKLKPYAYSIVDTFGSMYADDVVHLYSLINRHLSPNIKLGFHSHNNLMLAASNSQLFITLAYASRDIMIDGSILGCGRGAGNTHTELMMQYINTKFENKYNIDELLDLIDVLMPKLQKEAKWGYSIPYFLSGIYSSHVFNVNYILKKHKVFSKDLRAIIEQLDEKQKKQYNYPLLEKLYVNYFANTVDDSEGIAEIRRIIKDRKILFILPGASVNKFKNQIQQFIAENNPLVISLNDYNQNFKTDVLFFSSPKRYESFLIKNINMNNKIILTSNIKKEALNDEIIVNYLPLIKYGWINLDASILLALRLLLRQGASEFIFAGFDGFFADGDENYYNDALYVNLEETDVFIINKEIKEMLQDVKKEYDFNFLFITPSQYEDCLKGDKNV